MIPKGPEPIIVVKQAPTMYMCTLKRIRRLLSIKCASGDLLRLESEWRKFKRTFIKEYKLRPIIKYFR